VSSSVRKCAGVPAQSAQETVRRAQCAVSLYPHTNQTSGYCVAGEPSTSQWNPYWDYMGYLW